MQETVIEFLCHDKGEPYEVQLEPEPILFVVSPQTSLKFVAQCDSAFNWAILGGGGGGIQLCPESKGDYDITIYENDVLLLDCYKYMKYMK